MIYFDNAANKPVKKEVLDELIKTEMDFIGNSNSSHETGLLAHEKYLSLEKEIMQALDLDPTAYDLIFTSGATESNNLAIKGIYESYSGFGNTFLSSEFEHSSTNATMAYLKDKGANVSLISTTSDGKLSIDDLKNKLNDNCILLALSLVESEVGTIQDYQEVQKALEGKECKLLLDATQGIGKIPVHLNGIDMISFGGHKFGGITGTGILLKKKEIILTPLLHGGKAESPYRSGSTPLGLFSSFAKALTLSLSSLEKNYAYVSGLSSYLRNALLSISGIRLNSFSGNPYINNFSLKGVPGGEMVKYLSSKVINAIYHDKQRALTSFRISLSENNTKEEINKLIEAIRSYHAL
ncbi:MAG: aminotransferase class V-fold PLP-dependent enzyme [Mollicutes bacterium]|nr:aminotransferase class V-fold PLP-dependent enzyme [Mollicutes bacterium]